MEFPRHVLVWLFSRFILKEGNVWNTNHNMQNMKRSSYLGTPSLLCVSTLLPIQTCIPKDRSQKAGGQDDKCHQLSSCSAVWMETRRGHRVLRCNLTRPASPWTPSEFLQPIQCLSILSHHYCAEPRLRFFFPVFCNFPLTSRNVLCAHL